MEKLLYPKPCNYDKLGEDGFVPKNTYVSDGDIIIGKIFLKSSFINIQHIGNFFYLRDSKTVRDLFIFYNISIPNVDHNHISIRVF